MHPYPKIALLSAIYLEDSWVLDIAARPGSVTFKIDFVLTPDHSLYSSPQPGESYCFRKGNLSFSGVKRMLWTGQGSPPAIGAGGEIDYGNIDSLFWSAIDYVLEGDWGQMEIQADKLDVQLD